MFIYPNRDTDLTIVVPSGEREGERVLHTHYWLPRHPLNAIVSLTEGRDGESFLGVHESAAEALRMARVDLDATGAYVETCSPQWVDAVRDGAAAPQDLRQVMRQGEPAAYDLVRATRFTFVAFGKPEPGWYFLVGEGVGAGPHGPFPTWMEAADASRLTALSLNGSNERPSEPVYAYGDDGTEMTKAAIEREMWTRFHGGEWPSLTSHVNETGRTVLSYGGEPIAVALRRAHTVDA